MPTVKQYQKVGTHTQTFEKGGQKQDKERVAYSFLTAQGWTPEQTIGIIGNIKRESGFNPNAVGDGGKAFGLVQWHPDRQAKAKSLYGDSWKSFENQLKFIDWELKNTEKAAGDRLRNTKGAWQAGQVVSDFYERPQIKFVGDETRQTHVADAAMKFKGIKLTPEDNINYGVTFENSVAPYMNAPQVVATPLPTIQIPEMQTQQVSYLEIPQETTNLAEETEQKQSKINPQEEAFMQDLLSQMAEGVGYVEPEKSAVFQDGGIKIKDSKIQGKGVFLDKSIGKGTTIGLAHTNEQPSTDLGKYHNHSENPNSENIKIDNDRFIVSIKPIKKGEEVTVDYRKQPELEQPKDFKQLTQAEENFLKDLYS